MINYQIAETLLHETTGKEMEALGYGLLAVADAIKEAAAPLAATDALARVSADPFASMVISLNQEELVGLHTAITQAIDAYPTPVKVWVDPIEQGFKVKIGGSWSPPMGRIET